MLLFVKKERSLRLDVMKKLARFVMAGARRSENLIT